MRDKPVGGKKKTVPSRYSEARNQTAALKKFNDYYGAADVKNPQQRAATAQQRQQALARGGKQVIAKKIGGYGPSAPSASGTKKTKSKSAAYETRAGMRRPKPKPRIPNTK